MKSKGHRAYGRLRIRKKLKKFRRRRRLSEVQKQPYDQENAVVQEEDLEIERATEKDGPNKKNLSAVGKKKFTIVLLEASLHLLKTKNKKPSILSADDQITYDQDTAQNGSDKSNNNSCSFIFNHKYNRPDILHQSLLSILDSPANKSGLINLLVMTNDNKLISVNNAFRIPRNWVVFNKIMVDFLTSSHGMLRTDDEEGLVLLALLSPPHVKYIPKDAIHIEIDDCGSPVKIPLLFQQFTLNDSVVFYIRCSDRNDAGFKNIFSRFVEYRVSISGFPITSSVICSRIVNEIECFKPRDDN